LRVDLLLEKKRLESLSCSGTDNGMIFDEPMPNLWRAIMLRAISVVAVLLAPASLPWQAVQAQQLGISNLYVASGVGAARFVGTYSTRAKCLRAANDAGRNIVAINIPSDQPQSVVLLFCVPGGS